MENTPTPQANTGPNRNLIIGVVIAIVLCCCCLVTGAVGYYGYQTFLVTQQTFEQFEEFENFELPTSIPNNPFNSTEPTPNFEFDLSNDVPAGGLADDEARLTAWFSLQFVAILSECYSPTVEGTTITVIQQPDANGEWREEWNINCGDGTSKPFTVTFTPENGTVNVNVDLPGQ